MITQRRINGMFQYRSCWSGCNSSERGSCPNCELPDTDLSYKVLAHAELNGANLRRANFMRTELKYAKLIGADLRFANFTWADLYQADFTNANLSGALLAESRNLSEAIFCRTVMPDGAVSNLNC